jgi:hypothetical protein
MRQPQEQLRAESQRIDQLIRRRCAEKRADQEVGGLASTWEPGRVVRWRGGSRSPKPTKDGGVSNERIVQDLRTSAPGSSASSMSSFPRSR